MTRHFFEKKNSENFTTVARLSSREARGLSFNIYLHTLLCFWLAQDRPIEMTCAMVTRVAPVQERHPGVGRDPEKNKKQTSNMIVLRTMPGSRPACMDRADG